MFCGDEGRIAGSQEGDGMSRASIASRIAQGACRAELITARAIGHPEPYALQLAYGVLDETLERMDQIERPAVWSRIRMVGNR
jgi:hypothetical protein